LVLQKVVAIEGTGIKSPSKAASRMAMAGDSFNESDYQSYLKAVGIKYPRTLSPTFNRMMRENYQQDKKEGIYKDGQIFNQGGTLLNRAPDKKEIDTGSAIKEEKPTIGERVASFTGDLFNAFTGTQSAVAQTKEIGDQIFQGGISSNAYSDSVTPKYQDKRIFRGGGIRNDKGQVVTLGGNPSSGSGEEKDNTEGPFSFLKAKPIVREEGQTSVRTKGGGDGNKEPFAADRVGTVDLQSKEYLDAKRINEQISAKRRPIETDSAAAGAEAFRKEEALQKAKKIAERNPNVTVSVDKKGQPVAKAVQQTRDEAGPSARTAEGNQARVKQNAQARAQAAAINRQLSGTTPKTAKERAQDAAEARKKAGPNRTMSDKQQTRAQAGASARTAQGNRARVKANARKRAQAAARRRKKNKKCDIFLKYNISPLTNMNLIRDDLAEVAYFVKEIQEK
jgi:colicin import membrane protein